nr:Chain A, Zinc finger protein 473 [Homo sapiens]
GSSGSSGAGENPFKCSKCDRVFTQRNYLVQHERTHARKSGPSSG